MKKNSESINEVHQILNTIINTPEINFKGATSSDISDFLSNYTRFVETGNYNELGLPLGSGAYKLVYDCIPGYVIKFVSNDLEINDEEKIYRKAIRGGVSKYFAQTYYLKDICSFSVDCDYLDEWDYNDHEEEYTTIVIQEKTLQAAEVDGVDSCWHTENYILDWEGSKRYYTIQRDEQISWFDDNRVKSLKEELEMTEEEWLEYNDKELEEGGGWIWNIRSSENFNKIKNFIEDCRVTDLAYRNLGYRDLGAKGLEAVIYDWM